MNNSARYTAWSWLPLKSLATLGCLSLGLLLVWLVPVWFMSRALDKDIDGIKTDIYAQEIIQPLMSSLTDYLNESEKLIGVSNPFPVPDSLAQVVDTLQQLAAQTGMRNAHFLPIAETVLVVENTIRLEGRLTGTLEQFRCFSLLLVEQPWLSSPEYLEIVPSGDGAIFTLSLWAFFRRKEALSEQSHF